MKRFTVFLGRHKTLLAMVHKLSRIILCIVIKELYKRHWILRPLRQSDCLIKSPEMLNRANWNCITHKEKKCAFLFFFSFLVYNSNNDLGSEHFLKINDWLGLIALNCPSSGLSTPPSLSFIPCKVSLISLWLAKQCQYLSKLVRTGLWIMICGFLKTLGQYWHLWWRQVPN